MSSDQARERKRTKKLQIKTEIERQRMVKKGRKQEEPDSNKIERDRQTDRRVDGQTDGQIDRRKGRWAAKQTEIKNRQTDKQKKIL